MWNTAVMLVEIFRYTSHVLKCTFTCSMLEVYKEAEKGDGKVSNRGAISRERRGYVREGG